MDAIIYATCAILAGHRDGNIPRIREYNDLYTRALDSLRREYATGSLNDSAMGNAIGAQVGRSRLWGIGDWEST
jgi:hypothetical protein